MYIFHHLYHLHIYQCYYLLHLNEVNLIQKMEIKNDEKEFLKVKDYPFLSELSRK